MDDLKGLLERGGLLEYAELLAQNRIGVDILDRVTDDDLKSLGVPLGDRIRLLEAFRAAAAPPPPAPAEPAPPGGSEIRQITAMFVDLVGSTQLSQDVDIEDYHAALAAFHRHCTAVVKAHGGTPARYIGDALLACFGYPRAHEDDAVRALRAAAEIVEGVPALQTPAGAPLAARVGLATGVAMTGELMGESDLAFGPASGATLNLAARLQSLAEPGTVFLDDETRRLGAGRVAFAEVGLRELKGFAGPRRVWRVADAQAPAPALGFHHGPATPLVGRDEEMEFLAARWRAAGERSGLILLTGEPGIGKSRLLAEFVKRAGPPEARMIYTECLADEAMRPLHPVIRAVQARTGARGAMTVEERRTRIAAWAEGELGAGPATTAALARLLSAGAPAEGDAAPPEEVKARLFEALLDLIARLGADGPVLWLIEDLHWADPTTGEFLEKVIEHLADLPVLVICTARPEYRPDFVGEPRVSALTLARLGPAEADELVARLLSGGDVSADLAAEIVARTDGVPLFLEELTRAALESGALLARGAGGRGPEASGRSLPTTLLGSLLARLDRAPGAHHVAPVGAAIGRTFSRRLLRHVVEVGDAETGAALDGLVEAGILVARGEGEDLAYSFKHALMQDAAYETLPKSRRITVHRRISETLEAHYPVIAQTNPAVLARHFLAAEDFLKACEYWRLAAEAAQAADANREAVAHINAALAANARTGDETARLKRELSLRKMLFVPFETTSWGSDKIAANLERMRELHELLGEDGKPFGLLHGLAGYHFIAGRVSRARALSEELLSRYGEDPVAHALGLRSLAFCDMLSGRFDAAIEGFRRVVAAAPDLDAEEVGLYYHTDMALASRSMIAWAQGMKGDAAALDEEARRVEALIAATDDRWDQVFALGVLAAARQGAGDAERCLRLTDRALPLARDLGSDYWIGWAGVLRGWAEAARGAEGRGRAEIEDGLRRYASTGSRQLIPYAKLLLAEAHFFAGERAEAEELVKELQARRDPPEVRYIDDALARLESRILAEAAH